MKEQDLLAIGREQNDARVTFYKHLINTLNSTIHLVVFSDTYLFKEDWWINTLPQYHVKKRFFSQNYIDSREKEIDYITEHLIYSYFIFVFHTFEHSFKIICEKCYFSDYVEITSKGERRRDFKNLVEKVLPKLNLWDDNRKNFIEIVVKFRNSIHNNGVYINYKKNSHTYLWNCKNYTFEHGKNIEVKDSDLWTENIKFSYELICIFDGIVNSITEQHIEDITEPIC